MKTPERSHTPAPPHAQSFCPKVPVLWWIDTHTYTYQTDRTNCITFTAHVRGITTADILVHIFEVGGKYNGVMISYGIMYDYVMLYDVTWRHIASHSLVWSLLMYITILKNHVFQTDYLNLWPMTLTRTHPRYCLGTFLYQILGPYVQPFRRETADRKTHS